MKIEGLSHLTFIVSDLQRAAQFFCEGLGAEEIYDSEAQNFSLSHEKFFLLGGIRIACMAGDPSTERTYRHVAFKIDTADLAPFESRLRALHVEIKLPRARVDGEAHSLYFYDFDHHLFELHTGTLTQRLDRYMSAETVNERE